MLRKAANVLVQSIFYTFAPEDGDRAESLLHELRDLSRGEAGIVSFEVARSEEKPNVFALWECYRDRAALDAHYETEHFKRLGLNGVRQLAKQRIAELAVPIA